MRGTARGVGLLALLVACGGGKEPVDSGTTGDGGSTGVVDGDADGFAGDVDCDDGNPAINPSAAEICDEVDNNCNGLTDEGLTSTFYVDEDGDAFGDASRIVEACGWEEGLAEVAEDCDDANADVNPGMEERCNGFDDNCDGETDEVSAVDARTWYLDVDLDSYGDEKKLTVSCEQPEGHVPASGDCDDENAAINPSATEICNDLDDNCDGVVDTDAVDAPTWYRDVDGDGYGEDGSDRVSCDPPDGYAALGGDCAVNDATINPGQLEVCDTIDNDCDASTGEDGLVSYVAVDGSVSDFTSYFSSGTWSRPEGWVLSGGGTYRFCSGTFYTYLELSSDVELRGMYGASETILSSGQQASVLTIDRTGVDVTVRDLTLSDGYGTGTYADSPLYATGGGVACTALGSITLVDSVIQGSSAEVGGGIYLEGCEASLSGVTLVDNSADYGGAMAILSGSATVVTSELSENAATYSGGGAYVDGSASTGVSMVLNDSLVEGNAAEYGGGVAVFDAGMSCSSTGGDHGFFSNSATYGGGAFVDTPTSFRSTSCDWGSGRTDNLPEDVYLYLGDESYTYGSDASFSCGSYYCSE